MCIDKKIIMCVVNLIGYTFFIYINQYIDHHVCIIYIEYDESIDDTMKWGQVASVLFGYRLVWFSWDKKWKGGVSLSENEIGQVCCLGQRRDTDARCEQHGAFPLQCVHGWCM